MKWRDYVLPQGATAGDDEDWRRRSLDVVVWEEEDQPQKWAAFFPAAQKEVVEDVEAVRGDQSQYYDGKMATSIVCSSQAQLPRHAWTFCRRFGATGRSSSSLTRAALLTQFSRHGQPLKI